MRSLLVANVLTVALCRPPLAAASSPEPLRIAIECESNARTRVCPDFLRGFVARSPRLLYSPRSSARVVLHVAIRGVARDDLVRLRFVGDLPGAPEVIEIDARIDSRASDDEQLAQLEPAFLRGIALYVAALDPAAVTVTLRDLPAAAVATAATSPWGLGMSTYGYGGWSGRYTSLSGHADAVVSRIEPTSAFRAAVSGSFGVVKQPDLRVEGTDVSLDSTSWSVSASAFGERHLADDLAISARTSGWRDDPKGQYRAGWEAEAGLEWDRFASDDPRGNVLALAYLVGYRAEWYNFRNELDERFAHYPTHQFAAAARVRRDRVRYGLGLSVKGEVAHPGRRHSISGSPAIEIQLGAHVDLGFSLELTKRELPEPDIPADDFEALSRGDYAEAFTASGSISVSLHWDATNGAQNNRFREL